MIVPGLQVEPSPLREDHFAVLWFRKKIVLFVPFAFRGAVDKRAAVRAEVEFTGKWPQMVSVAFIFHLLLRKKISGAL